MEISYDAEKRALILAVRGLDFDDAVHVFAGTELTVEDDRKDYGETRYLTMRPGAAGGGGLDSAGRNTAHHHNVESE